MIRTPVCDLLDIEHPIALGGMGSATSPALVAAVSRAGGLGAMGCHYMNPEQIRAATAAIRRETNKSFGLNFLVFDTREDSFAAALELRPAVMQFAWPRPEQDIKSLVDRAHEADCKVTFMAGNVPDAVRAAMAGADIIIAQGTEGGHVGWMASMPLIPMVVDAVAPIRCLQRVALPTVAGSRLRCRLAPTAFCSARDFWRVWNRRCIQTSSRQSWTATATTPSFPRFRISPPVWFGLAP
jgi:NAD(P)H-dependent flavin oxidoreductase YrpB (nitropropane dioxygenase family)